METNLLECTSAETANVIQHFMLNVCVLYAMTQHFAEWIQYSLILYFFRLICSVHEHVSLTHLWNNWYFQNGYDYIQQIVGIIKTM